MIQITAFEAHIGQPQVLRPLPGKVNGGRRAVDTDNGRCPAPFGVKSRQDTDAAADIENGQGIAEMPGYPSADLQIIFIPLAVERGNGAGLSGQIVERNFSSRTVCGLPFGFDVPVKSSELLRGEHVSLPGKVGRIGFDVPKSLPG